MYISLANSLDHCTQGGTGDGGDTLDACVPHTAPPSVSPDTHMLCSEGNADGTATAVPPMALP